MDLLELAIGACLVVMSAFLALYGPLGYPGGVLVAVVILIPACVFIYLGAFKGDHLRTLVTGNRPEQAAHKTYPPKVSPSRRRPMTLKVNRLPRPPRPRMNLSPR